MMDESSSGAPDDYGYPSLLSQSSLASLTPPSLLLPPSSSVLSSSAAEGLRDPFSGFSSSAALHHHQEHSPSSSSPYSASSLSNEEDRLSRQSQLTIDGSQALVDASSSKEAPSGACCPREVTCSVCRRKVEDLLLLSCSHHLCLVCACRGVLKKDERLLASRESPRRNPRGGEGEGGEALACPLCHVPTRLSPSTLASLRRLKGRGEGRDPAYGSGNALGVEEGFVFDDDDDQKQQEEEEEAAGYDENLRRLFPGRMSILRLRDEEKGETARKKAASLSSRQRNGEHDARRRRRVVLYERGGQAIEDDRSEEDARLRLPQGGVRVLRRKHDGEDEEERGGDYLCCECEDHEASVFCKGCVRNYCDVCAVRVHEENPRFRSHQFRSLLQTNHRRRLHTSSLSSSSSSSTPSLSSSLPPLPPGEDQESKKSRRRRGKTRQAPDGLLLPVGGPAITERVRLRGTNHIKSFQDAFLDLPGGGDLSRLSSSFFFPSSSSSHVAVTAAGAGLSTTARGVAEGGQGEEEKQARVKKPEDEEGSVDDLSTHTSAIDDHVMGRTGASGASGAAAGGARDQQAHRAAAAPGGGGGIVHVGYLLKQIQQGHPLEDFLQLCSITALACDHHPCEPVRYFCRTCVNPPSHCLCSECMLGREHRGHFLQKTYEAWRDISARIVHEEWMSNLAHTKVETEGLNRQFLKEKRLEWGRALYEDRQLLLGIGAQLREMIQAREQDLRSSLQQFLSRFSHEVDGFRREIHEKTREFQTHLDRLRNEKKTLDPLVLIDCYRKNYASIQAFLQMHQDPENDLFSHLPKSRMSLLGHATQVVEELCALSFEARERLRIADGHYGENQEREKAEREAALKLREEEYRKLQRGKEEEEEEEEKKDGGKEGQEEEKEEQGNARDKKKKKKKESRETSAAPDDGSPPDEAPF